VTLGVEEGHVFRLARQVASERARLQADRFWRRCRHRRLQARRHWSRRARTRRENWIREHKWVRRYKAQTEIRALARRARRRTSTTHKRREIRIENHAIVVRVAVADGTRRQRCARAVAKHVDLGRRVERTHHCRARRRLAFATAAIVVVVVIAILEVDDLLLVVGNQRQIVGIECVECLTRHGRRKRREWQCCAVDDVVIIIVVVIAAAAAAAAAAVGVIVMAVKLGAALVAARHVALIFGVAAAAAARLLDENILAAR